MKRWVLLMVVSASVPMLGTNPGAQAVAGDLLSGTYLDPAEQRPDILPHHLWKAWPEYRARFNRPRYVGGHIAAIIEPTSQEAMAWHVNKDNGNYAKHRGKWVPHYYYPKPWEAMNTKARPDFVVTDDDI